MPAASTFDTANAGAGGKRTGVRPKAVKWPDRNANTTRSMPMTDPPPTLPKPKKSVALSGTAAGNTALCTVGRSGNDLHYRGYDIKDLATKSTFEEVAHLLVHGALPTASQLKSYKRKLRRLRGLPAIVQEALELVPANAHPMDVMRTGCSVLGRSATRSVGNGGVSTGRAR